MAFTPKDFTVWIEIPVRDLTRAAEYYARVTGAELVDEVMGEQRTFRFPTATAKGVGGHLFQGEPAAEGAGSIIHLACNSLEAALDRVRAHGGTVLSDPIAIPDGRFAYTRDPDGNGIGFFEAA